MKKPKNVETIDDAVNFAVDRIKQKGNNTVEAVLFYGNTLFSYDPDMKIEDISDKEFKQDVKFDFFVFVDDIDKYYQGKENGKRLAKLNEKYPLYFNKHEKGIKWKIGIYDLEYAMKNTSFQKKNLYLAGRLHKPVDIKYCKKSSKKDISNMLYRVKKEGMKMALKRLNKFRNEDLIYNIVRTNYLAEAWRFEFYKPRDIIKKAEERLKEDYIPILEEMISEGDINILKDNEDIAEKKFVNINYSFRGHLSALKDIARLNIPSLNISLKQVKTNKGGVLNYVGRKIKKILTNIV